MGMRSFSEAIVMVIVLLLSLTVHEYAHALVASWKGDNTAKSLGRLTLNPFPHIDIFGTIVFPLIALLTHLPILGWAKPVPVDPRNLKEPVKDMMWISLAGPVSNFSLAILMVLIYYILIFTPLYSSGTHIFLFFRSIIFINLILGTFNLLPLAPLDGWSVLMGILPPKHRESLGWLEQYGFVILMLLLITGLIRFIFIIPQFLYVFLMQMGKVVFL